MESWQLDVVNRVLSLGLHNVVRAPRCWELHALVKVRYPDMRDLRRCILQRAWFDQASEDRNVCDFELRWLQGRCGMSMRFVGLDETSALRATSLDSQACAYIDGKWGAVSL